MLLLENGDDVKQITVEEFAKIMHISKETLERIRKNPVFEINPTKTKPDKLNGGVIAPAGKGSKAYIYHEIEGITHILRYYESRIPDKVNPRVSIYEPKRVIFEDQLSIFPKFDMAVFMFALPHCADSPNAVPNWHYSFQNKEKKATETRDNATKIGKALALVNNTVETGGMTDGEISLVAKGIYAQNREGKLIPNPSQKNKSIMEIRADLTDLIFKNVDVFLDSTDNDVNAFYGMVLDAVDKGIFAIRKSPNSNIQSWYWESGPVKDQLIVDISGSIDAFDALKGAIEADPNKYYYNVMQAVKEASGKASIQNFIKEEKAKAARTAAEAPKTVTKAPSADIIPPAEDETQPSVDEIEDLNGGEVADITGRKDDITFEIPKGFNEAAKLLQTFNNGVFPPQAANSAWWKKVKAGEINIDNVKAEADAILTNVI